MVVEAQVSVLVWEIVCGGVLPVRIVLLLDHSFPIVSPDLVFVL